MKQAEVFHLLVRFRTQSIKKNKIYVVSEYVLFISSSSKASKFV